MAKDKKNPIKKIKSKSKKTNVDNLNIKNKNYNLIKVKTSYLSLISASIFTTLILILLLGYIIFYLNNLRSCQCFQDENNKNVSNIDYLIIIEALSLAMNIIILINLLSLYLSVDKIKSGGAYSFNTKLSLYIGILVYIIVYGFFVYNVFKLSENVKYDCVCSSHPIRYLLYIQAFITFIYLILLSFGLFII